MNTTQLLNSLKMFWAPGDSVVEVQNTEDAVLDAALLSLIPSPRPSIADEWIKAPVAFMDSNV